MGIDQFKESLKEHTRDGGLAESKETALLRKRISKWADSVEHHGLDNFGDKIEIRSVTGRSSYLVISDGEYEKRSIQTEVFSYSGKRIFPQVVEISSMDEVWQLNLPLVEKFASQVKGYGINEEVYTCQTCGGPGEVTCDGCGGRGENSCSNCGGSGRVACDHCRGRTTENCHRCGGRGSMQGDSTINYREITCPSCNGRQRVPCSSCGGSGAFQCSHCNNGRVVCRSCSGSGRLTCGKCDGTGQLVRCEYLKDAFIHKHTKGWFHSGGVSVDLSKRIAQKVAEAKDVSMIEDVSIPSEAFDVGLEQGFLEFLRKTLSTLQVASELGSIGRDYRILRQRIGIRKVEVAEIAYRYESKEYVIWSYGTSGMWAGVSPISEVRERLFESVQQNIKQKDLSTALEDIDKAIVMAEGEGVQSKEYKKLRGEIIGMIKRQYLMGGIVGGTIVPVIGNIFGAMIGMMYWNVFEGRIRLEKQRFLYPCFASLFVGVLIYCLACIQF